MKTKRKPIASCNVLDVAGDPARFWSFENRGARSAMVESATLEAGWKPPARRVRKDWQSIVRPRINIAWLPASQVFIRVLQLPAVDFTETESMVSLQLEKLSPLPVNQVVWSVDPIHASGGSMQSVIVLIALREGIENLLKQLEIGGYQADQIELAAAYQVEDLLNRADGVWLYPFREHDKHFCLTAWWFGGSLQQLQLVHLPGGERALEWLRDELTRTAWAGEMEGWLPAPAKPCHLVAEPESFAAWEPMLQEWSGAPIIWVAPASGAALAEKAVERTASGARHANLLPAEYLTRYHENQVDRVWMNGLAGLLAIYLVGILIYFGFVEVMGYRRDQVKQSITALGRDYTNSLRLDDQIDVLQKQLDLKYGALDCLYATSSLLPVDLTLDGFSFGNGMLSLRGTAPLGKDGEVTDFNGEIRKAVVDGRELFTSVTSPSLIASGQVVRWSFNCTLRQVESE